MKRTPAVAAAANDGGTLLISGPARCACAIPISPPAFCFAPQQSCVWQTPAAPLAVPLHPIPLLPPLLQSVHVHACASRGLPPPTHPNPRHPLLQAFCAWGTRPDGSVRLTWPYHRIESPTDATPLREWLGAWLHEAPRTVAGLPLISLNFETLRNASKSLVHLKGYLPREGKVQYKG